MIKVAIVEDEKSAADASAGFLRRYAAERGVETDVAVYDNALRFLDAYKADRDIVFMDIEMPDLDGMKAAELLRARDPAVLIVFVTNMQQYAIRGYAVNALDFLVKPVTYFAFATLLDKAAAILRAKPGGELAVKTQGGMLRFKIGEIKWVEVRRHRLTYHTESGDHEAWGNLGDLEKQLPAAGFSRCNIGYLVNLAHVSRVDGDEVVVGGVRLKISRPRKREFLADLAGYLGSGR